MVIFVEYRKKLRVVHKLNVKGATPRFVHLEKFSLNFSSLSFAVHINLLHP